MTDCLCYTPKNYQGDKHQSSTRPRPSTQCSPSSSWLFVFYPVRPVLHYYQHFSYFNLKWHPLMVVRWSIKCTSWAVVSVTAWWGLTDTATSWRWDPALPAGGGQDCYIYSERLTGGRGVRGEGVRGGGRVVRAKLWAKRGTGILAQADIWLTQTSRGYSTLGTRKRRRSGMVE